MASTDVWTYRSEIDLDTDMSGFDVEAIDGGIGSVDEATYDAGSSYVVVDTGPWIFGSKVMLPAAVIERVDLDEQRVYVNRTKDEVKAAPQFDESRYRDDAYRGEIGSYYGVDGAGYRGDPTGRDTL
ncbi:MAG: PRC-barrel domain containing protein [Actinomycetota bacterium]|jgi:hypothetical protein|nr:PRC-barrel domain containing protein [Actinomycetota bacterium]MDP9303435.1 PRC-barrel domain containing protein [Actinomycetota bacterium]